MIKKIFIMKKNSKLYEINIRVWLNNLSINPDKEFIKQNFPARDNSEKKKDNLRLIQIPKSYWKNLADKGFNYIWLMGIWETTTSNIDECCFEEYLVNSYNKALKDWKREDVVGSPYSINRYELNPEITSQEELLEVKKILNDLGIGLILDFIPNHFSSDSEYVKSKPEIFLEGKEEFLISDPNTFYRPKLNLNKIFAHGRDPFFAAWTDTIQINYFNPKARQFMIDNLKKISKICDGVRCDMAMLVLNNVFKNTWQGVLDENNFRPIENEFWQEAISEIKSLNKNFLFLAETYWDLEWQLQQLGFDFTYDKKLYDRLKDGSVASIQGHLNADYNYQLKSIRFIENHDEERSITTFGPEKMRAAAVIISTIQGMKLFFDGQFEGRRIRLPIQLNRFPDEKLNKEIKTFYDKLLNITKEEIFSEGEWQQLQPLPAWHLNHTNENFLSWNWNFKTERRLIVINYSKIISQCRIKFDLTGFGEMINLKDIFNDKEYLRATEEIITQGLYVELHPFHFHIFTF